jgi:glycosyltransferase involved in cell wall biosynthesis
MSGQGMRPCVGVLLKAPRSGLVDISARSDAQAPFEPGGNLPFDDRSVESVCLGDAVTTLSVRDQIQLLMQCRRVSLPGGAVLCAEDDGAATYAVLARWAELVGLVDLAAPRTGQGWQKRAASTDTSPLVSILIPSSNPRYFLECLDSAIAQTYQRTEIIICDDCESDAITRLVASRTGQATIQYVKNPARLRGRANFEKCLSLARGEYIKFLNDDDVLEPECVATLLGAFLQIPDLVLATSHRLRINSASQVIDDMPATRPAVNRDLVIDGVTLANAIIMYGMNFIGEPSTAMFRRRDFEKRPRLDAEHPFHFNGEQVRGAVDLAMWSRLLVQGNAAFFRKRLSRFRIHAEQAQARPNVVALSIAGTRGLQRQWIDLGLFRRYPPHLLLCQPLTRSEAEANDWRAEAVRSLRSPPLPPEVAIRVWRATRRHAFEGDMRALLRHRPDVLRLVSRLPRWLHWFRRKKCLR